MLFTVIYTNEECTGNETKQMEIDAPSLESAYEKVNLHYPDLCIDQIFPA